jgi:hypothetical protein
MAICKILLIVYFIVSVFSFAADKQRIFVLTDISNEPDDEESMVRFLVYANEYDIEGLVATTSTWLRKGTREDLIRRQVEAYGKVRDNLLIHAKAYPTKNDLLAVTCTGQQNYGMGDVADGRSSPGSKLLLKAADKADDRPLWVCVWGGANTLAQALLDAKKNRSAKELARLIAKLRVYTISDQDDTGKWLRKTFPNLLYIVSPSTTSWQDYHLATWTGIAGDQHYKNGPKIDFELVSNPWLLENIINNHGPLGKLYPKVKYIMEGDTPSFIGLIKNGLGWSESPGYGGWAGRYVLGKPASETRSIWTDTKDTVVVNSKSYRSGQATIWRWRKHFQHDFAARMDWCVADTFQKANHNPIAVFNTDRSKRILKISAKPGETLNLSSKGSIDPDSDKISSTWMIYQEAGSYGSKIALSAKSGTSVSLKIPNSGSGTIHIILTIEDDGNPSLVAYRRIIIMVK